MKYKNVTNKLLSFRAFDTEGEKRKFFLKPQEVVELGKEANFDGLELVKIKKNKGDEE